MNRYNNVWRLFVLTAFCVCLVHTLAAQELKTIEVKHPRYTGILERFQVLADQPEVKQGTYQKFIRKKLVESGSYVANRKEGIWEMNDQSHKLVAKGEYKEDRKTGIWVYYAASGIMVQMYDHDLDSMIYFDVEEERKRGYAPAMFPDTSGERMPLFIGGNYFMMVIIENNLIFPEAGWRRGRDTQVFVSFSVDAEGHTTDVESLSQAGYGFDEEAVRLVRLLGDNWIPGFTKGKFVKVGFTLPVTFKFI